MCEGVGLQKMLVMWGSSSGLNVDLSMATCLSSRHLIHLAGRYSLLPTGTMRLGYRLSLGMYPSGVCLGKSSGGSQIPSLISCWR